MEFQVVRVIGECRLIDEDSFEHVYWRRDGKPLALGYYVVDWPPGARAGRFNEDAVFHGPYHLRSDALAALRKLEARATVGWSAVLPGGPEVSVFLQLTDGTGDR